MLNLCNSVEMYLGVQVPSRETVGLGTKMHSEEDYIREKLLPHLGLSKRVYKCCSRQLPGIVDISA